MNLPADLIQEFAKLTNDTNRNTTSSKTMYGTIMEVDNSKWVQIDGSDLLTPISSVTNVSNGDRVTVTIQNHKAIINGNFTAPSTTAQNVIDISGNVASEVAGNLIVDELNAEYIRVNLLLADYIKTDELDAAIINSEIINAKFIDVEDLRADRIEVDQLIADSIIAERAEIDVLLADKADIKVLESDYATIKQLEANRAEIDLLIADKADIEDLNTINATIENLDATYATIEYLNSEYATIENLNATNAYINDLNANKADIADLNAVNANVGTLTAEVADINTLIFGSATGDTIHVNFANAVVQQIGDAQIKSAMIESIAASKITAGYIITNNVRVMSDDGSLLISDETIQISDGTRVRVQIGKDASNDYSINIWDADGNLMFSEGGITDKAIKEAIIRNDMVSNNANISASKLDINSLFTEINGSTNTIKSTKIYLDDEKQTLDVVFKSMDTTVTEMGETVSSQGTQISAIQGQITSKIWQQDIETAKNELNEDITTLNTQYSELTQDVDGFKTSVSSTINTVKIDLTTAQNTANVAWQVAEVADENATNAQTAAENAQSTADSAKTDISNLTKTVTTTYATKSELTQTSEQFQSSINKTYSTVEELSETLAETNVNLSNVDAKATGAVNVAHETQTLVTTTYATKSQLTQTADSITSTVESTYQTIDGMSEYATNEKLNGMYAGLYTKIIQTESSITSQASSITSLGTRVSTVEQTAEGLTVSLEETQKIANSGAKKIDTHMRNFTAELWQTYGEAGHSENWTTGGNYDNSHIGVGDIAYIVGTVTDAGGSNDVSAMIYGTVESVTQNGIRMTSLYYIMGGEGGAYAHATNAAKTATNFMNYDSTNGLLIGNKSSGSWSGNRAQITSNAFNILNSSGTQLASFGTTATIGQASSQNIYIDSDSVDIRKGTAVLASFDEDTIYLGRNSSSSTVNLCAGAGEIYATSRSDNSVFDTLNIESSNIDITARNIELCTKDFVLDGSIGYSRISTLTGNITSGTYVGDYRTASMFSTANPALGSNASVSVMSYNDYDDASEVRMYASSAHDGPLSSIVITPYSIEIDADTDLMLSGNTTISGNLYLPDTVYVGSNDIDINRIYPAFTPRGTSIAENSDLNTMNFIKIGNYYSASDANTKTLANYPAGTVAFMMQVYAPLVNSYDDETKYSYRYRIRKIMTRTGDEYVQSVYSGATAGTFTYGDWKKVLKDADAVSLKSTLTVSGITTLSGSLIANGATTLNKPLTINDGTNVCGPMYLKQASNQTTSENTNRIYGTLSTGTNVELLRIGGSSTEPIVILGDGLYSSNGTNGVGITHVVGGTGVNIITKNNRLMFYDTTGDGYTAQFRPNNKGKVTLGAASYTWYAVYAANSTIQTSDRREKENIIPLGTSSIATFGLRNTEEQIDIHSELFDRLQPVQYNFIDGNGRICYGLVAQDVISAMDELGIGENELDLVHHEYHVDEETGEEFDTYGLAYANLISLLIHEVQKLKSEVKTLKGETQNG